MLSALSEGAAVLQPVRAAVRGDQVDDEVTAVGVHDVHRDRGGRARRCGRSRRSVIELVTAAPVSGIGDVGAVGAGAAGGAAAGCCRCRRRAAGSASRCRGWSPRSGWRWRPGVAHLLRGRRSGWRRGTSAAAPATCGVAIEVPLIVLVAVSLVYQAEVMLTAGREDVQAGAEVGERRRGRRCWSVGADGDRGRRCGPAR